MSKIEKERAILSASAGLLEKLYGKFSIDENQVDRPDAAIILKNGNKIGIEITTVDKPETLQYFNDKYAEKPHIDKQLSDLLENGSYSQRPIKSKSIMLENHYALANLRKKESKYREYLSSGNYEELIIVAFSSYMKPQNPYYKSYHIPWTNHLLSKVKFPFDKVILVCAETKSADLVYDKKHKKKIAPKKDTNKELGVTNTHGPILPFGKSVNINEIMDNPPLVQQRVKQHSKKKKK
ncbi:hypothetical protein [Vibrio parahaemolyticus]|uniref:hypothetical protein n=1 Tax=Vibrio parahaemolyticus TaxID=670 RepID=UPI00111DB890|nr:hypothetical protein [Vibrio parahaemolyticus]TOP30673.1 hypothetical protein CGH19_15475 [Vibrio parahaemolyticus]